MTQSQTEWCERWCREHASSWQVLNRAKWKYAFRARTLVRFVEEVNLREDEVTALLDYLASDACIATLQLYDQSVGAEWTPIRAWLELSNKSHGNIHAVRLYHALQTEDGEHSEMYFVENGCAAKVWMTYYWNQPEVIQPVPASESGVSYRIGSVAVDPDTGLYSYVLEKRERVQQDLGPYVAKETVYERTTVESHQGVRADMVDSTGPAAGVADGTITTRSLSKNADCTTDVSAQSVKDKPVAGAQKRVEKTLEGVIRSVTDRNQPQPPAVDLAAMKPGSSVTVEKTDSGLYNNTVTEADETPLGVKGEDCRRTIYEHAHSTTENVPDRPTIDAPRASGGVTVRQGTSMTRHGTWDVHTTESREQPVADATKSYEKTLHGTLVTTVDRNQPDPVSGDGMKVGESRSSRRTEGGLYDNTVSKMASEPVGMTGESCENTAHAHSHTTTENVAEPVPAETAFEQGRVVRTGCSLNSRGTADVTTHTVEARPSRTVKRWYDGGDLKERCTYRNQPEIIEPSGSFDSVELSFSLNDFGLYDGGYVTVVRGARGGGGGNGGEERTNLGSEVKKVTTYDVRGRCWERAIRLDYREGFTTVGKYLAQKRAYKPMNMEFPSGVDSGDVKDEYAIVGKDRDGDGRKETFCQWKFYTAIEAKPWRRVKFKDL